MPRQVKRKKEKGKKLGAVAFLVSVFSLFLFHFSLAWAHRLEAEAVVRPFGTVQVETWFETGDSPKAAKVSVFGANGQRLTEGQCNERGVFVFPYSGNEPLRVVVDAGAGHRAETTISAAMLTSNAVCTAAACLRRHRRSSLLRCWCPSSSTTPLPRSRWWNGILERRSVG